MLHMFCDTLRSSVPSLARLVTVYSSFFYQGILGREHKIAQPPMNPKGFMVLSALNNIRVVQGF